MSTAREAMQSAINALLDWLNLIAYGWLDRMMNVGEWEWVAVGA